MSSLDPAVDRLERVYPWSSEAAVALADLGGHVVAAAGTPQGPSLQAVVEHVRQTFADFGDGDVAISNDPAVGCADVTQLTMVRGHAAGTAIARVRIPDIGGFALGGLTPDGYDIWGEGARFPALRMAVSGRGLRQARELLILNSRTPRLVELALSSMETATAQLAVPDARSAAAAWDSQHRDAASALASLRPGIYTASAAIDAGDRWPAPVIRGRLELVGTLIRLDFSASDAEVDAPVNCSFALTADCCALVIASRLAGFDGTPAALSAVTLDSGVGLVTGASERAMTGLAVVYSAPTLRAVISALLDQAGATPAAAENPRPDLAPDSATRVDSAACCLRVGRATAIRDHEASLHAP